MAPHEPPTLPLSLSTSKPSTRRRRTSLSGKLLDFFSHKPRDPPSPPLRPVISSPQPLQSRVPVRPKRDIRQVASDENDPNPAPQRPRSSRPRLRSINSDDSVGTLRSSSPKFKLHVPPSRRDQATRPIKSALKKSLTENQASSAVGEDHSTRLSTTPAPAPSSRLSNVAKHVRSASWKPFLTRNQTSSAPPQGGPESGQVTTPTSPQPKKMVTFAAESSGAPLRRTASMVSLADSDTNHWEDIAVELDAPVRTSSPSRKRKVETTGDPRYGTENPQPGLLTLTRPKPIFTPVVRKQTPLHERPLPNPEGQERKVIKSSPTQQRTRAQMDAFLAEHAVPLPAPKAAFELPPPRTIVGGLMDEFMKDYAREKNRSPQPVVTKRGPSGVLQRINIDIVPNERHVTVWDAKDGDIYAWSGSLVLRDSKAASYFYPRHCIQDFFIEFAALSEPAYPPHSSSSESEALPPTHYEWRTTYSGQRGKRADILAQIQSMQSICVESEYKFVEPDHPDGPCAWLVNFWVPIPLALMQREECRVFVCRARVTVGDWETPRTVVPAGCVSVTIESLKSDRMLGGVRGEQVSSEA